jgi:hypothetical protein
VECPGGQLAAQRLAALDRGRKRHRPRNDGDSRVRADVSWPTCGGDLALQAPMRCIWGVMCKLRATRIQLMALLSFG